MSNVFHTHLDGCTQCREHPFDLCGNGARLLRQAALGEAPGAMGVAEIHALIESAAKGWDTLARAHPSDTTYKIRAETLRRFAEVYLPRRD